MKSTSHPGGEAASRNIVRRIEALKLGTGGARPSRRSAGSSSMQTPASRKSGNGRRQPTPESLSGLMTALSAPANPTSRSSSSPSLAEPPSRTRKSSSTPVLKETCAAPSTFAKAKRSTRPHSSSSFAQRSQPIRPHSLSARQKRSRLRPGRQRIGSRLHLAASS